MRWDKISKVVTANWPLKLMSLGLAVLSWFLVTEAGVEEMTVKKVLVEVLEPAGVSTWTVSSPHLRVKLVGPAAELRRIKPTDVRARYVVEEGRMPDLGGSAIFVNGRTGKNNTHVQNMETFWRRYLKAANGRLVAFGYDTGNEIEAHLSERLR